MGKFRFRFRLVGALGASLCVIALVAVDSGGAVAQFFASPRDATSFVVPPATQVRPLARGCSDRTTGDCTVNRDLSIGRNANTTGNSTVGGNQAVVGSQTVAGDQTVTGNSAVGGNSNVGGALGVTGISTFTGGLNATGGVTASGLTVNGSSQFNGDTATTGNSNITGAQTVGGNQTVGGSQAVTGSQTIGGNQAVTGNQSVGGTGNFGGLVTGTITNAQTANSAAALTGTISGGQVVGPVANATNAVNATNATNATNAVNATTAGTATFATTAGTANRATIADGLSGDIAAYRLTFGSRSIVAWWVGSPQYAMGAPTSLKGNPTGVSFKPQDCAGGSAPAVQPNCTNPSGAIDAYSIPNLGAKTHVTAAIYDGVSVLPNNLSDPENAGTYTTGSRITYRLLFQSAAGGYLSGVNVSNLSIDQLAIYLYCPANMNALSGSANDIFSSNGATAVSISRNGGTTFAQPSSFPSSGRPYQGTQMQVTCNSNDPNFNVTGGHSDVDVIGFPVGTIHHALDAASQARLGCFLNKNPLDPAC